jgi:D-sedoheptulose 7-phosphate isomerase
MHATTIQNRLKESILLKQSVLESEAIISQISEIVTIIKNCFQQGNKLLLCGNGGSAADALHLAAEFSGRYYLDRKALNAEALNVNVAALTAVSNDYSFEKIFARLLEAKAEKDDVLWVFSTSGNSQNIVEAVVEAQKLHVKTIAFTGETGGKLNGLADLVIKVPSTDTPRIQELHMILGHIICELVEKELFGK